MMDSLTPSTFGLPDEIPPGTTVLPYMTHLALAAAFDETSFDPAAVYKRYLPLVAAAVESFVISPRIFCACQIVEEEKSSRWSIFPTLEFWRGRGSGTFLSYLSNFDVARRRF